MKPITGEAGLNNRMIVCVYLCVCVCVCIFVCVFVHSRISYVHIAWLTEHYQRNISHLYTYARPPSVNDYEMEVVVRASRTVKWWRWSNNQLSKCCYERDALNRVEMPYLPFVCQQAALWSPPEQVQIAFMQKYSIRYSWGTSRMPKHCSNTFLRPLKIKFAARGWNYFGGHLLW